MSDLSLEELKKIAGEKLENRYLIALTGIIAFSAFVRFEYAFFEGMWVDEANMARMAVDISGHPLSYMTEWKGHIEKRLPVFIYSLILSKSLLGGVLGTETAVRIVNPVIGTATVLGIYVTGREMYSKKTGVVAAALLAVNPLAWFLSERILIGMSLTGVFVAVVGLIYYGLEDRTYSKYALWLVGPFTAIALLTKQPAYTLGLILPMYFLYRKRESFTDYLMTDKDLKDSQLWKLACNVDYYISAALGIILLLPWMIRNMGVCGFPMCGMLKALSFASKDVTRNTASVQTPFYYLFSMGMLLTLPVLAFLIIRLISYIYQNAVRNSDVMVKKIAAFILLNLAVFVFAKRFVPLMLLSSVALFATEDSDKLLWLWTGIGIGFMSIPEIKVPRYVVFTIPAMVLISSRAVTEVSGWIGSNLPVETEKLSKDSLKTIILALIVLPIVLISFNQGVAMVASNNGSPGLQEAGNWLRNNMAEGNKFAASSPQMKFYARPHIETTSAGRIPNNSSAFKDFAREENLTYLVVDVYERTQPDWLQLEAAPYRLPQVTIRKIRQGPLTPSQVVDNFRQNYSYLIPVAKFGKTGLPLTRSNQQPTVTIYRINQTALK
jgi:4-amino-4-deoxy-L-arabinose transferase-like glycosyltransferase